MFAPVAQLVEQRTENPRVAGSIPALGTTLKPLLNQWFFCYKVSDSGWIARRACSDGETDIGRDRRHEQEERKLELRMTTRIARARSAQQFSL